MKCPKCGKEIKDGSLFCPYCFADIKVVPVYDPQLEQQISETMTDIKDDIGREEEEKDQEKAAGEQRLRTRHRRKIIACVLAACALAVCIAFGIMQAVLMHSESYYVARAYDYSERGDYGRAAKEIKTAIGLKTPADADLILREADYLAQAGDSDAAVKSIQTIIDQPDVYGDRVGDAYRKIISIYSKSGDYAKIAEVLGSCKDKDIRQMFQEYMVFQPQLSAKPGSYDDVLNLSMTAEGNGSIFYTLDGKTPTTESNLYDRPIRLSKGRYTVRAVYVNHFGVSSEPVTALYEVNGKVPDAPSVSPSSGNYDTSGQIVAESKLSEGEHIFYTTDGSDPDRDSALYTGPITMKAGKTTYCFAVIGADDVSSDVTEVTYTVKEAETKKAAVSKEDAPNYILVVLIKRGEVISTDGVIANGLARYSYDYISKETIGETDYYLFSETMTDTAGNATQTGRVFAVSTQDGRVGLYNGSALSMLD